MTTTMRVCVCAAGWLLLAGGAAAQELLDRVLARVGATAVTMTDVQAAVGLGLVEIGPGADPSRAGLEGLIDRRLLLAEVARFPPPDPPAPAVAGEVSAMKARAGDGLGALMARTGLDERRLREMARDTLRIRAYIAQRFGTSAQVRDEDVRAYYDQHPDQFRRGGRPVPFEQAEDEVRERASEARLRGTIDDWIADLRMRAEIVRVGAP
jgi:hypothetical protein